MCPEGVTKINEFDILLEFSLSEAIVEVEITQKIQRICSWDGLVVNAFGLISSKRYLVQVIKEREEGHRKQENVENKHHLIRQEMSRFLNCLRVLEVR